MASLNINESGPVYTAANVIAFAMQVIEITYFKLNGKQHSVITVPCFRMWLLYDRASERNNFYTNPTRKDWAFITYKQHSH